MGSINFSCPVADWQVNIRTNLYLPHFVRVVGVTWGQAVVRVPVRLPWAGLGGTGVQQDCQLWWNREVGARFAGGNEAWVGKGCRVVANCGNDCGTGVVEGRINRTVQRRVVGNRCFPTSDRAGTKQSRTCLALCKRCAAKYVDGVGDVEITGSEE